MNALAASRQRHSVAGLAELRVGVIPALELVYFDGLAAHLRGSEAVVPPYTIEHGITIVSLPLRAVNYSHVVQLELGLSGGDQALTISRKAVVQGAHRFAARGAHGSEQLVARFLATAVGELERNQGAPNDQVRSLFCFGMLAIASGPENTSSGETAKSLSAVFRSWDELFTNGFRPPWRVVADEGPNGGFVRQLPRTT